MNTYKIRIRNNQEGYHLVTVGDRSVIGSTYTSYHANRQAEMYRAMTNEQIARRILVWDDALYR